ncbi:MarR family winged helix-turn-helix transcriptional regulator [Streptosporangium sp. NPDC023963]|uniref:MarR family winged helix-turn-helix transcriptional regulator n=1 Tax=Streptosporangium sp. NPDC023963 TaxID=3155608 RepID=UPI00341CEF14
MTEGFDAISEPVARRVTSGLSKIGMVLRSRAWKGAGPAGVTPTQAQALELLRGRPTSLGGLAARLGVSAATASNAVGTLVEKGLVVKEPGANKRSVTLRLTPAGETTADQASEWPGFLSGAVETLDSREQTAMLRSLIKLIRTLQQNGDIPPQRICVTCRFFQPYVHADSANPHHCDYLNEPFGDRHLRLDCAEQADASPEQQQLAWQRFTSAWTA